MFGVRLVICPYIHYTWIAPDVGYLLVLVSFPGRPDLSMRIDACFRKWCLHIRWLYFLIFERRDILGRVAYFWLCVCDASGSYFQLLCISPDVIYLRRPNNFRRLHKFTPGCNYCLCALRIFRHFRISVAFGFLRGRIFTTLELWRMLVIFSYWYLFACLLNPSMWIDSRFSKWCFSYAMTIFVNLWTSGYSWPDCIFLVMFYGGPLSRFLFIPNYSLFLQTWYICLPKQILEIA